MGSRSALYRVLHIVASRLHVQSTEYFVAMMRTGSTSVKKDAVGDTMSQVVLNVVFARVTYCASTGFQEERTKWNNVSILAVYTSTFLNIDRYMSSLFFTYSTTIYLSVGHWISSPPRSIPSLFLYIYRTDLSPTTECSILRTSYCTQNIYKSLLSCKISHMFRAMWKKKISITFTPVWLCQMAPLRVDLLPVGINIYQYILYLYK